MKIQQLINELDNIIKYNPDADIGLLVYDSNLKKICTSDITIYTYFKHTKYDKVFDVYIGE